MSQARTLLKFLALVTLAMVVMVGCGSQPGSSNQPAGAKQPIVLGAVLPLTTGGSLYGKQMIGAVTLALKEVNDAGGINGSLVELAVEDCADTNTTAISALSKVLTKNPVALVGSVYGAQMLAMMPVLDQEGLPTTTVAGTRKVTQQGSKNVFRTQVHDGVAKVALAKYILDDLHKSRIGLLVVAEEWGYSARDIITAVLKDRNLKPAAVETYQKTDKDLSAQLLNLKKAGAEVIVLQGFPVDTALILKQVRQLNLGIPMISSSVGQIAADLDITEGADVNGLVVEGLVVPTQSDDPKIQAWTKAFKELMGYDPDSYALLQYDGMGALLEVMKKNGTTRDAIRKGLSEIKWAGLATSLHADNNGDMMDSTRIFQYDGNKRIKEVKVIQVPPTEQK